MRRRSQAERWPAPRAPVLKGDTDSDRQRPGEPCRCAGLPWSCSPCIAMRLQVGRVAWLLLCAQHSDLRRPSRLPRGCGHGATAFRVGGADAWQTITSMRSHPMAIETRETAGLIASDKVEGTAVYDVK